jgi:hypothetical protein
MNSSDMAGYKCVPRTGSNNLSERQPALLDFLKNFVVFPNSPALC